MRWSRLRPLFALSLACASLPLSAQAAEPNWLSVVGLYPQPATVQAQSEVAILLWLQASRTAQDEARADSERTPSLGCFLDVLRTPGYASAPGRGLDLSQFPRTVAVLDQARQDLLPILAGLQNTFMRPRPDQAYPAVVPSLPQPEGYAYPSTNAALGILFARILSQWLPADQAALATRGALLGTDRVLGGVHYPSDVLAGQALGKAFATYWIDQPGHLQLIQTACSEWPNPTAL